jgi:hypothetical protein
VHDRHNKNSFFVIRLGTIYHRKTDFANPEKLLVDDLLQYSVDGYMPASLPLV